jgi:hypothetical protein
VLSGKIVVVANQLGKIFGIDTTLNSANVLADLKTGVTASLSVNQNFVYIHTNADAISALNVDTGVVIWTQSLAAK